MIISRSTSMGLVRLVRGIAIAAFRGVVFRTVFGVIRVILRVIWRVIWSIFRTLFRDVNR